MKYVCTVTLAAGLLFVGANAQAQSLADVARQEQERRAAIKEPARVYTDADVQKAAPLTTAAARPQAAGDAAKDGASASADAKATSADAKDADKDGKGAKDKPQDEAAWRERMTQAREDLARSRRLLDAMEQQLVGLGIQASSAVIAGQPAPDPARQQEAAKEVDRLRGDVEKYTAALAKVEADARSSGIPPGWVR